MENLLRKTAELFGIRKPSGKKESLPKDFPDHIRETYRAVAPFTMTSPERVHALVTAVEYIVRSEIPGDMVECGVWRGGSMMAVALTLKRLGADGRHLRLYDTFTGMPPARNIDADLSGRKASKLLEEQDPEISDVWARANLEEVRGNMRETGYPSENISYVKGKVEETLPARAPDRIALLRLDTDWYASTRHELEQLYPRLSPGGVLIIDDYGHWQGARKAVDEYIEKLGIPILLCRIDYTGRIAVKPR